MDLSEFPECTASGDDCSDIDYQYMYAAAEQSDPFSMLEWDNILIQHTIFLEAGGGGGTWQIHVIVCKNL